MTTQLSRPLACAYTLSSLLHYGVLCALDPPIVVCIFLSAANRVVLLVMHE